MRLGSKDFNLKSVVSHIGREYDGEYIAFIIVSSQWYLWRSSEMPTVFLFLRDSLTTELSWIIVPYSSDNHKHHGAIDRAIKNITKPLIEHSWESHCQ